MTHERPLLAAALLALSLTVALPSPVFAALPAAAEGQPLPTLAPMLERATPAVVNIATESRIALSTDELRQTAAGGDSLLIQLIRGQAELLLVLQ